MSQKAKLRREDKKRAKQEQKELRKARADARSRSKSDVNRRLKAQEKELSTQTEGKRKARFAAKEMIKYIGYDAMYQDGIAQVEDGMFSQTIKFSDISYQSAREENQQAIFSMYCQLFDYFGAETSVQLNVINTPIPQEQIGNKVFFECHDDRTRAYVDEYNKILNDKMREGVSNLTRERYLTFAVGAKDFDSAVPKLARMRNDCVQTLARIRSDAKVVDGEERLAVMHSQLCPGETLTSPIYPELSRRSGLRTKDLIAPEGIDFKPKGRKDCFRIGDKYGQVLSFRRFGSELSDRAIADIIDLPLPLNLTLHIQAMDKAKAVAFVKQRLAWMDKEVIDEQMTAVKKGYDFQILPSELKYSKEEAEDLLDHLQNKNQRLFIFTGLIYTYADSLDELDEQVLQIMSTARRNSIDLDTLSYRQRQGLNSILPLGHNHVEMSRMMTTAQVAILMPFASQELNQPGGGYIGQSRLSNNLVMPNRAMLASPMGFVCGKPGSGKSFFIKREITNTILLYPRDEVIIFDPAGEYSPVIEALGGINTKFSPDTSTFMNPFDLSDVEGMASASQMAFKIEAILALSSATMAEGAQGLPEADKSIISRCVELAYRRAGEEGKTPTLGDFYDILREQPEPAAQDIALRYERYVSGALSFFNNQSNVTFNNRITNIDFKDLNSNMRVFGMLTALEAVRNRMYYNFERGVRTWLYIDEVQSLFSHPAIISYFAKFWAEGRKFNLVCTGITQNALAMLEDEAGRNMVLNSDFIQLFKQSPLDRQAWVKLLDLSAQEASYIDESVKPGEGLLICGAARIAITDLWPFGLLYNLWNTKPEEIAALKRKARFEFGMNKSEEA